MKTRELQNLGIPKGEPVKLAYEAIDEIARRCAKPSKPLLQIPKRMSKIRYGESWQNPL